MNEHTVLSDERVKSVVREFVEKNFLFENGKHSLDDDLSFYQEGIIDSTGILELVEFIENTFKISVEDEELVPDNLDSLSRISAYIRRKNAGC
jgi:acyl carrier protein